MTGVTMGFASNIFPWPGLLGAQEAALRSLLKLLHPGIL